MSKESFVEAQMKSFVDSYHLIRKKRRQIVYIIFSE